MKDITNKRFGRLIAIKPVGKTKSREIMWKCKCDCGNCVEVLGSSLRAGRTKSCGCYNKEISSIVNTKHGKSYTRLFSIWGKMKDRCVNTKSDKFKWYGKRGIRVCEEWKNSFQNFYEWAIKNGYQEHLTIDRIDVNGNYCPENCRWADVYKQANNKRTNRILQMKWEKHTLKEWSIIKNINYSTIRKRLHLGWSVEKTLQTQTKKG